jgi:hypothetical protein
MHCPNKVYNGGWDVGFYATSRDAAREIRTALTKFSPTTPAGTRIEIEPDSATLP